jgi:hypothetical protein
MDMYNQGGMPPPGGGQDPKQALAQALMMQSAQNSGGNPMMAMLPAFLQMLKGKGLMGGQQMPPPQGGMGAPQPAGLPLQTPMG